MERNEARQLKRLAVLTSGGDAPGMNAAIRAVVRMAIFKNLEVVGVIGGLHGLIRKDFLPLQLGSVANIIQRGGTILKTGRSPEFHKAEYRELSYKNLKAENIDALICIGGDGTFRGAHLLSEEHPIAVVGVPGTIDNDIFGTDNSVGFDTAVNTALEAIDRIRDTAASHDRLFIIEVMGRSSGFIALSSGIAGGAESIFIPEYPVPLERTIEQIKRGAKRGKLSSILITAEGQKPGRAYDLAESIRKKSGLDAKVCILGHIQRGGSPTASDRILASRLGARAVECLIEGQNRIMIGTEGENLISVPLKDIFMQEKKSSKQLLELAQVLSI